MPRYYFDITDQNDEIGTECADDDDARRAAMSALPVIASEYISSGGDQQTFSIVVRDGWGETAYAATLVFDGRARQHAHPSQT